MELSRLIGGGTPLVMNVFVHSAAAIEKGAALSGTAVSTSLQGAKLVVTRDSAACNGFVGVTQISSAQATQAKSNVSAMNAYRFNMGTDGLADGSSITGSNYLPLCINPDALYYAEHSISVTTGTTTASDAMVNGITASTGTVVTVASTSDIGLVGGWIMDARTGCTASASSAAPTYNGQLRYVTDSSAITKFGLTAYAMNVSVDSNLLWASPPTYQWTLINASGTRLCSACSVSVPKADQGIQIIDNFIIHDQAPLHPLRQWVDNGLNSLTQNRLYSEIWIKKAYL